MIPILNSYTTFNRVLKWRAVCKLWRRQVDNIIRNPLAIVPTSVRNGEVFRMFGGDILEVGDVVSPLCIKQVGDILLLVRILDEFGTTKEPPIIVQHLSIVWPKEDEATILTFLNVLVVELLQRFGMLIWHLEITFSCNIELGKLCNSLVNILSACSKLKSLVLHVMASTSIPGNVDDEFNKMPHLPFLKALDLDFDGPYFEFYNKLYEKYAPNVMTLGISVNFWKNFPVQFKFVRELCIQNIKCVTKLHEFLDDLCRLDLEFEKIVFVCELPFCTYDLICRIQNLKVKKIEIVQYTFYANIFPEDPYDIVGSGLDVACVNSLKVYDHNGYTCYHFLSWFSHLEVFEVCFKRMRRHGKSNTCMEILYALSGKVPSTEFWTSFPSLQVLIVGIIGEEKLVYRRKLKEEVSLRCLSVINLRTSDEKILTVSIKEAVCLPKIWKQLKELDVSPATTINVWLHSNVVKNIFILMSNTCHYFDDDDDDDKSDSESIVSTIIFCVSIGFTYIYVQYVCNICKRIFLLKCVFTFSEMSFEILNGIYHVL